jgi:hypothetical protein
MASTTDKYQVVNGVQYKKDASDTVVKVLEEARLNGTRISILYGDIKTGKAWKGGVTCCGYVGKNSHKLPVLLATKQSSGGECIMDSSVLEIKEAKGGKVLYQAISDNSLLVEETFDGAASISAAV